MFSDLPLLSCPNQNCLPNYVIFTYENLTKRQTILKYLHDNKNTKSIFPGGKEGPQKYLFICYNNCSITWHLKSGEETFRYSQKSESFIFAYKKRITYEKQKNNVQIIVLRKNEPFQLCTLLLCY